MLQLLAKEKSAMRQVIDHVEDRKRDGELQRKETDDFNLQLQSFLYEKSYYTKEIHLAREFKTPKLDKVISKASEIEPDATRDFQQLNSGISTDTFNKMIVYLNKVLQERQNLANKLQETEDEKKLTKSCLLYTSDAADE